MLHYFQIVFLWGMEVDLWLRWEAGQLWKSYRCASNERQSSHRSLVSTDRRNASYCCQKTQVVFVIDRVVFRPRLSFSTWTLVGGRQSRRPKDTSRV
jgi:hypothetical protein